MVLKRFVKSLDFRLQCWVWKKIKLHGTQTTTIPKPRRCTVWKRKKLQWLKPLKITNVQFWEKMKLHGTQTELSQPYPRLDLEKDEITWYSNQVSCLSLSLLGWEGYEITWYSNKQNFVRKRNKALEKSKIAWFSNKQGPIFFAYISAWKAQRNRRSTCAHFEQRSMRNSQRFEGLEEDEITWHSNQHSSQLVNRVGLAEDKITWYSNNSYSCLKK